MAEVITRTPRELGAQGVTSSQLQVLIQGTEVGEQVAFVPGSELHWLGQSRWRLHTVGV